MRHLGDYAPASTLYFMFTTYRPSTGAAYTLAGTPVVRVYKNGSTTQHTTTYSVTADFDSVTGLNYFTIDTSADGTFYAAGGQFTCVLEAGTVDSVSIVGTVVGTFTLNATSALRPTTAGRTLVVDASGLADANMVKMGPTGSGTAQTARDIGASVLLSSGTGAGQISLSSGLVTLAGVTHTGAVIPTVTTLTGHTAQTGDSYARIGANGAGLTAVPWNAAWDAEVQSEVEDGLVAHGLDHLVGASVADTDVADNSIVAKLTDSTAVTADFTNFDWTTDSLRAIRDRGDAAWLTATGFSTHAAADVWAVATRVLTANTNLNDPTAAAIADAVWDEAIAGHLGAGSTGEKLNDAGAAGDPWNIPLPGAYGAGTAGKIVGDNLNAPVATVDTVVDAIKAVTDLLPDSGALSSLATAAALTTVDTVVDGIATQIGTAGDGLTAIPWNSGWTTALLPLDTKVTLIKAVTDLLPDAGALSTIDTNIDTILAATGGSALTEAYAAVGAAPTLPQILFEMRALMAEKAISGTTLSVKKLDGSTQAATYTLDDATTPTSITRAT